MRLFFKKAVSGKIIVYAVCITQVYYKTTENQYLRLGCLYSALDLIVLVVHWIGQMLISLLLVMALLSSRMNQNSSAHLHTSERRQQEM